MDPAFRSCLRVQVPFALPTAKECSLFWRDNARHLSAPAWSVLGRVSHAGGLSFRDMDHIAENMVQETASGGLADMRAYLRAIFNMVGATSPSALAVAKGVLGALYRSSLTAGSIFFAVRGL